MTLVSYELDDGVATVTMDDGKVNALSPAMFAELGAAFDGVEKDDAAAVVLAGRPGRFSAGFDLGVLGTGGPDALVMLRGGFELAERLLSFPVPVVAACTGHALAMVPSCCARPMSASVPPATSSCRPTRWRSASRCPTPYWPSCARS